MRLPTEAAELLAALVGRRIAAVRREVEAHPRPGSLAEDGMHGAVELELDDGSRLHAVPDGDRRSVIIETGGLPDGHAALTDVSTGAFWRWRLRRPVTGVLVWKSLDVAERARELEFGVEVALAGTRGFVVELVDVEGVATLAVTDGTRAERHRAIRVAGSGSAVPAEGGRRASRRPDGPGRWLASRRGR